MAFVNFVTHVNTYTSTRHYSEILIRPLWFVSHKAEIKRKQLQTIDIVIKWVQSWVCQDIQTFRQEKNWNGRHVGLVLFS